MTDLPVRSEIEPDAPASPPFGSGFRVRCAVRPGEVTRQQHDLASQVVSAALAEVGIDTRSYWDDRLGAYRISGAADDPDAFHRARALGMQAAGIPYEVLSA
jgi:hypothetical protein